MPEKGESTMTRILKEPDTIIIDDKTYETKKLHQYGYLPTIETEGPEFYLAESSEEAGEKAREYWADMVENDPDEFVCVVGKETLVKWALGQWASPGSTAVNSLDKWLDLTATVPEEQWAAYDGMQCEVQAISQNVAEELGWNLDVYPELAPLDQPTFEPFDAGAYRWN